MHGVIELDLMVPAIITWTALATALVAATIALVQNDIKKVLAYSTVSQLGFMFLAVGAGYYSVALFHVVTHAFFKACLFLSAGSVIYGCHHEQDMRSMGGLAKKMPLTCLSYGVSTLAIAGIAPFAGYFSKHAILEAIGASNSPYLHEYLTLIQMLATAIAICTALYMTRSFILTFLGSYRGQEHPHEAPLVMTSPVLVLALLSVVGGWFLQDSLLAYVTGPLPAVAEHQTSTGILGYLIGSIPGVIGIVVAFVLYFIHPGLSAFLKRLSGPLYGLLSGKYFVDELYDRAVVSPIRALSGLTSRTLNQTFVEGTGSALGGITRAVGELTCRLTTGQVATYVLIMFGAAAILLNLFVQVR
jgi:NADH-quinone oxidoreductase subunit L